MAFQHLTEGCGSARTFLSNTQIIMGGKKHPSVEMGEYLRTGIMTYFAVLIQVLQPSDGNVSYVTSAKEDFTCGQQWLLLKQTIWKVNLIIHFLPKPRYFL